MCILFGNEYSNLVSQVENATEDEEEMRKIMMAINAQVTKTGGMGV